MFIQRTMNILYQPTLQWSKVKYEQPSAADILLYRISLLAMIPAISLCLGTTQIGWSATGSEFVKLEMQSAMMATLAFYFAMCTACTGIAYTIHWMQKTYGGQLSFARCLLFTTYTATPMFFAGLVGLYPMLWFNVTVVLGAVFYSIYLLFTGIPIMMNIAPERAVMFSFSVLTAGLCILVGLMVASVILWSTVVPLSYISS